MGFLAFTARNPPVVRVVPAAPFFDVFISEIMSENYKGVVIIYGRGGRCK